MLMGRAAIAVGALLPAAAQDKSAVNVLEGNHFVIHGYDPVAYFVEGVPRKGRPDLAVEHAGAQ
jgi:hypothetical protein